MEKSHFVEPARLWSPTNTLSPRVKRLRDAQKHPEEYSNLLARVTGYNAYFVGLGREIQDEIIARESHQLE